MNEWTGSELKIDQQQVLNAGFYLGNWAVEPLKGTIARSGTTKRVEPKVMDVLVCLASDPGEVCRREELLECVWGDVVVSEEVLTRCISELRSALGDTGKTRNYIQTLPKRGYRLLKPVRFPASHSDNNRTPQDPQVSVSQMLADEHSSYSASSSTMSTGSRNRFGWLGMATLFLAAVGMWLFVTGNQPNSLKDVQGENTPVSALAASDLAAAQNEQISVSGVNTVAVLPFVNLSGGAETDYFANGITADIRNTLVRLASEKLRVVARTSSEVFRGQAIDIRSIGSQLGANLIVEGTVRISDQRVRVTAQLTKAGDGFPVWAERFEHDLSDGLLIQSAIADEIVQQLLPSDDELQSSHKHEANLKAYDYYLLGRHHWNRRTPEALDLADNYFRSALEQDSDYVLALSGLADTLILREEYGGSNPEDAVARAKALVNRALKLQPDLGEAHASQGMIANHLGDKAQAEASYRKAVELKPNYSMGRMWLGNLLLRNNNTNEAFEHFSEALQFDPLNPIVQQNHLRALSLMGRYEEAAKLARAYFTDTPSDRFLKTWMYAMLDAGRYDELLSFAVRHTFTEDYADYGTELVIKALIMLQRFDEAKKLYEQLSERLGDAKKGFFLAALGTALRDSNKLRRAAMLMEGDDSRLNPYSKCNDNYVYFWRAIAAHIERDFQTAAQLSELALTENLAECLNHPVRRAEIESYYVDSLKRSGQTSKAIEAATRAQQFLSHAVDRGRNGLDIAFSRMSLQIAAGEITAAQQEMNNMQNQDWQYYAKLANMPLFDDYREQLHDTMGHNAQQFAMMQNDCKGIGMTKFGI
ncbi:MAG: winged helix-turn-helix domain-containing protein [Pseudomonadota bacterium]